MRTVASGFLLVLLAGPVYAQNTADARWSRWNGCWELVLENSREGAPTPNTGRARRSPSPDPARPQVCVEPSN